MVGNEGFEPPMPDSESGALPLGEFPTVEVSVVKFVILQENSSDIKLTILLSIIIYILSSFNCQKYTTMILCVV